MLIESRMLIMMSHKLQKFERRQVVKIQRKLLRCLRRKKYIYAIKEIYWVVKLWIQLQKGSAQEVQRSIRVEKHIARISFQFLRPLAKLFLSNRRFLDEEQKKLEEKIHQLLLSIPLIELNEKYPEFMQKQEALTEEFLEQIYQEVDLKQLKAILDDEVAQEILLQDQLKDSKSNGIASLNQGQPHEVALDAQQQQNKLHKNNLTDINLANSRIQADNTNINNIKGIFGAQPPPHSAQLSYSVPNKQQRLIDLLHFAQQKQLKEEQEKANNILAANSNITNIMDHLHSITQFPSRILEKPFQAQLQQQKEPNESHIIIDFRDGKTGSTKSEPTTVINSARANQFGQCQRRQYCLEKGITCSTINFNDGYIRPKRITDHSGEEDAMISSGSSVISNNQQNFHAHHQRAAKVFDLPQTLLSTEIEQTEKQMNNDKLNEKINKTEPIQQKVQDKTNLNQQNTPNKIKNISQNRPNSIIQQVYSTKQCKDSSLNFKNTLKKLPTEQLLNPKTPLNQRSFKRGNRKGIFLKMNSCERLGEYGKKKNSSTHKKSSTKNQDPKQETIEKPKLPKNITKDDLFQQANISLNIASNKYIQENDFQFETKFQELKELTNQDLDDEWKYIITQQNLSICQKQQKDSPKVMVRAEASLENYSQSDVFEQIYNISKRVKWDTVSLGYQIVEAHPEEKDVVYFYSNPGFGIQKRDFLLKRIVKRDFPEQGQITILYYSTTHPLFPEKEGWIRVASHIAGFIIKQSPDDPESSLLSVLSSSDLQGKIPAFILNCISWKFIPEWVESLKKALKEESSQGHA